MFSVFENNKPAKYPECKVHPSWNNNNFSSFEDAEEYALNWLGEWAPSKGTLKLNKPYDIDGLGDFLEIRKISD